MLLSLTPILLASFLAPIPRMPRGRPGSALPPMNTSIALVVKTGSGETRATVLPQAKGEAQRPIATIKAGEKPQIRWQVRNLDAKKPAENVALHFLIHREKDAGALIPDQPQQGSLADQVLGTDLPPKGATSGSYNTAIHEAGVYLVEVELLTPQGERRQYVAIDLKVEGAGG